MDESDHQADTPTSKAPEPGARHIVPESGTMVPKSGMSPSTPESDWTPPSWDEVVRTHSARVYRLAYRLTGNVHDAEDLTQEVFVRVFR